MTISTGSFKRSEDDGSAHWSNWKFDMVGEWPLVGPPVCELPMITPGLLMIFANLSSDAISRPIVLKRNNGGKW